MDATETYIIIAWASIVTSTSADRGVVQIVINGIASGETTITAAVQSRPLVGVQTGVTGATSYVIKLQASVETGTGTINPTPARTLVISAIAFPQ
mgnify:CR=1 FL=1